MYLSKLKDRFTAGLAPVNVNDSQHSRDSHIIQSDKLMSPLLNSRNSINITHSSPNKDLGQVHHKYPGQEITTRNQYEFSKSVRPVEQNTFSKR
jgi:hypothetical protein